MPKLVPIEDPRVAAAVAAALADALGETEPRPREELGKIVRRCGAAFCEHVFRQAARRHGTRHMRIFAPPGRRRRRTLGGCFFFLTWIKLYNLGEGRVARELFPTKRMRISRLRRASRPPANEIPPVSTG